MTLETKSFEDALSSILDEFDINELSALQESAHAPEDELDEIRLYCDVDPVLADMYKHYADAKSEQASILASHGKNDPMADVAFDRVDSAWSAIVTRGYRRGQGLREAFDGVGGRTPGKVPPRG